MLGRHRARGSSADVAVPGTSRIVGVDGDAETLGRDHIRGSSLLVAGRVLSLVFTVTTQVVMVRALSVSDFGSFAYALAIVAAGRTMLSLGQGKMLSRFLSSYEEERDYGRLFGSILLAVGTIVLTSTVFLVGLLFLGQESVGAVLGDADAVDVLLVLAFLAPLEALDQCFIAMFAVFARPSAIFFRRYLLTPVLRLVAVVVLVVVGGDAHFLALGYVGAQLIGIIVCTVLMLRVMAERGHLRHFRLRGIAFPFRAVFALSGPTLSVEVVLLSMSTGSVIVLAAYWSVVEVAAYRAVFPAARLNQFVFSSFVTLFLPLVARLFTRGDRTGIRDVYWRTALFLAVFSFPVFAMTSAFASETTVALFGERYAESSLVMALLAVGFYVNVVLGFNTYTLSVFGWIRFLIVVNLLMAVLNIGLSLILVPQMGAVGVALANMATLVTQNVCNQVAIARAMGSGFVDRRYVGPYLLITAAAVLLAVLGSLAEIGIAGAIAASGVVSVLLVVLTRRKLDLANSFPALARVPVIRLLVR